MSLYRPKQRDLPLTGKAWRLLRADVLADEPLCRHCALGGIVRAAEHVDHILNSDHNNNERSNLQALCSSCHSVKTAEDIHGKKFGFDAEGYSLDPDDDWFRGSKDR